MPLTERKKKNNDAYYKLLKIKTGKIEPKQIPLVIEPTGLNFKGNDPDNPIICSTFGCKNHLPPQQTLFGTKCIHCQKQKTKIDVAMHLSFPFKKAI